MTPGTRGSSQHGHRPRGFSCHGRALLAASFRSIRRRTALGGGMPTQHRPHEIHSKMRKGAPRNHFSKIAARATERSLKGEPPVWIPAFPGRWQPETEPQTSRSPCLHSSTPRCAEVLSCEILRAWRQMARCGEGVCLRHNVSSMTDQRIAIAKLTTDDGSDASCEVTEELFRKSWSRCRGGDRSRAHGPGLAASEP